jgi:outer membrane receptor protein involved in Fe transport
MTISQKLLLSSSALAGSFLLAAAPAWAQAVSTTPTDPTPSQPSSAQQAPDDDSTDVDEVVVVGSRIRRDTFNSPSPVQIITRDESTLAGFSTTTEALQSSTVTSGSGQINNAFGGFVTDGGPGANTIGLRGLGAGRTLVLINGRRVAPAGTRGAVGTADLNVQPSAIIDRTEILRDGASSVYGSDAIAGVLNIITRSDIDGIELEAQVNVPTEGEGEQYRFSVVGGIVRDRLKASGSLDYYERKGIAVGDRDFASACPTDRRVNPVTGQVLDYIDPATGRPKCFTLDAGGVTVNTIGTQAVTNANRTTLGLLGNVIGAPGSTGNNTTFNRFRPNSAVTTGVVGFEGVGGGTNNLNVRDTFYPAILNESLISPVKTYVGFGQASYELGVLGDAEVFGELLYARRESEQVGSRQLALDYRLGSPLIPSNLAFSNFAADQGTSGGQRVGVRAFIGFGNDLNTQEVDFYKLTAGVRGDFFLPEWRYEATVSSSKSEATYTSQSFLTSRLINATDAIVAPAGTDPALVRNGFTCRINTTNPAERCIVAPPLTAAVVGGQLPQDFRDYIFVPVTGNTEYREDVFTAIIDGPIFELPAGEIQGVLGVEYRTAEIQDQPDPNSVAGNLLNLTSSLPTAGDDNVSEVFAEIDVPILADQPLARELTLNGSVRYTDYESYGSDTTYKVGALYSPLEGFSVRATFGTSFRAPALFEQFQGATSGFQPQAFDPCNNFGAAGVNANRVKNCQADLGPDPLTGGTRTDFTATQGVTILSQGGAAAGLEAETSENLTIGIIAQPRLPDGAGELAIAIDYFDIVIENGVNQPGAANVRDRCYNDPAFKQGEPLCKLVSRNPTTTQLTIQNAYTNISTELSEGIDYTVRYTNEVGPGELRLTLELTNFLEQASATFPDSPIESFNDTINAPKWVGEFSSRYVWNDFTFRYGFTWIQGTDSYDYLGEPRETSTYDLAVDDYYRHNASIRYDREDDFSVTLGIRNMFDNGPPTISQVPGFYNTVGNVPLYSAYDYVGREVFLNVSKVF